MLNSNKPLVNSVLSTTFIFSRHYHSHKVRRVTKTVKINDDTHAELLRIAGELQAHNGHTKTLDDAIKALIQRWHKAK